jgi:hypothetical protein
VCADNCIDRAGIAAMQAADARLFVDYGDQSACGSRRVERYRFATE